MRVKMITIINKLFICLSKSYILYEACLIANLRELWCRSCQPTEGFKAKMFTSVWQHHFIVYMNHGEFICKILICLHIHGIIKYPKNIK